jgi:type IV pilus biogenesis protein CpaD/CtpE
MSKIDELQYPIHHGIAQGDQGVNTAEHDTIQNLLQQYVHDAPVLVIELTSPGASFNASQ